MLSEKNKTEVVGAPDDPKFLRFVGLDLSLKGTGLVALDYEGNVLNGKSFGYTLERGSEVVKYVQRLIRIAKFVFQGIEANSFSITEPGKDLPPWERCPRVAIEGYAYSRGGAGKKKSGNKKSGASGAGDAYGLGELGGTVKTQLWLRWKIEPRIYPVSSARKAVFDSGRISKPEIKRELEARGIRLADHNIRDAYVIAETLRLRHIESERQAS